MAEMLYYNCKLDILGPVYAKANAKAKQRRLLMKRFFTLQAEIAKEQLNNEVKKNPQLRNKQFMMLICDRKGSDVFKVRRTNYVGLRSTINWLKDEKSMDAQYWNNRNSTNAPSKTNNSGRAEHCVRGVTSYIPRGAQVDLLVEVFDTFAEAEESKNAFTRMEAGHVRSVPNTTPELEKAKSGADYNIDSLAEEILHLKRYKALEAA